MPGNSTSPDLKLSVSGGGLLSLGTYGTDTTLSTSGGGTRMIWYPRKAAFRAGKVTSSQWDTANIGNYSAAVGDNTRASGDYSFATGSANNATGFYSAVFGVGSSTSGQYSFAGGYYNTSSGEASVALGLSNVVSGSHSIGLGDTNQATGANSIAIGSGAIASGNGAIAVGSVTTAESYVQTTFGQYNMPTGAENVTSWVGTDPLFVVGNGTASGASRSNAMMILKNGNVGVGTSTPTMRLDVNGSDAQIANEGYANFTIRSASVTPGLVFASHRGSIASPTYPLDGDNLGTIIFGNQTANFSGMISSLAVGSHGAGPSRSGGNLQFWTTPSGTNNATVRITIADTGNVGIGTATPQATLDVNGTARLKSYSGAPFACDGSHTGTLAATTSISTPLCICVAGTGTWVSMSGTACVWL